MYPELVTRPRPRGVPAADRRPDALHVRRRRAISASPTTTLTCRVHDECNGSDVFGSDICTCRPYLTHGIEDLHRDGAAGRRRRSSSTTARKAARWARSPSSWSTTRASARTAATAPTQYFARTECVAGVQDMRFQELMPDVLHWLGITQIHRFVSMSNMKYDAIVEQGIEIVEQVPIPDELIPADARSRWMPRWPPATSPRRSRVGDELGEGQGPGADRMMRRATPVARHAAERAGVARLAELAVPAHARRDPRAGGAGAEYVEDGRLGLVVASMPAASRPRCRRRSRSRAERFANPAAIPFHSRWRHFEAGGIDRWAALAPRLAGAAEGEIARRAHRSRGRQRAARCRRRAGLVAIASPATGETYARSEGWASRASTCSPPARFSRDPKGDPLRVDAERAGARSTPTRHRHGLPGDGAQSAGRPRRPRRAAAQAGRTAASASSDAAAAAICSIVIASSADGDREGGRRSWPRVLDALSPIWPSGSRSRRRLATCWQHPAHRRGLVPFHKLSQWLTYSLVEPLEGAGLTVVELDALTGLPEYRNGGLLRRSRACSRRKRSPAADATSFKPATSAIVEWRALTVALLDRIADACARAARARRRAHCRWPRCSKAAPGSPAARSPRERRPGGGPPIASTATARCSEFGGEKNMSLPARRSIVIDHPLVQHKLTLMRDKETLEHQLPPPAARDQPAAGLRGHARPAAGEDEIETPLDDDRGAAARRQEAGARADPARRHRHGRRHARPGAARRASATSASTATRETLQAVEYYFKMPDDISERDVIVCDPMLATGIRRSPRSTA